MGRGGECQFLAENVLFSRYRAIFDVLEMPWDWPVDVNYHEAKAFCTWKGPQYRLPTEAEHHRMRGNVVGSCNQSESPPPFKPLPLLCLLPVRSSPLLSPPPSLLPPSLHPPSPLARTLNVIRSTMQTVLPTSTSSLVLQV